ncbi:MAG TPA: T9SS type A sorting domain-containing protein [Saprospiraceae bacterium]|nr:T9SS type A sorting domain-containing protein [Saprospiraceae bacterium]
MLKLILVLLGCWSPILTISQLSFFKSYDFGTVEYAYQLLNYKNRVFVNSATWCGVECSYLSEIDMNGNILWRTEIQDIDIAQGTMLIVNDTITVTGNNDPYNTAFRMAHFSLDGEKIGETVEIEHPTKKYTKMFQLTTQYFSGRYVICGAGRQGDIHSSLIYVVNKNGILDSLISLDPTSNDSDLWDSFIDSQGRLTTFHWIREDGGVINYRKIYKFDALFDTVWSYRTEDSNINFTVPRGCELQDGRIIIAYTNPVGGFSLHSVRAINPDGSLDWQYDFQWYGSRTREISRLRTLRNGDIMGSGSYSEKEHEPRISDSPWLFRMSPKGELLWERTYYEFDSTLGQNGSSRIGSLLDFIELNNGDIMAVGTLMYNDDDMLIIRVDSNGCLDSEDCHEVNILTATEGIKHSQSKLTIYPNPVIDMINIELETNQYHLDIEMYDIMGKLVANGMMTSGWGQVETFSLHSGVYVINVRYHGQVIATSKFVKL